MSTQHDGWIGVDLDGTLAEYYGWVGLADIGAPIPAMVARVRGWIEEGIEVRIFTARVGNPITATQKQIITHRIERWCLEHIGKPLRVTAEKDLKMYELWDDRCVCVERNTGRILGRNR